MYISKVIIIKCKDMKEIDYELAQWEQRELQAQAEYLEEQGEFGK